MIGIIRLREVGPYNRLLASGSGGGGVRSSLEALLQQGGKRCCSVAFTVHGILGPRFTVMTVLSSSSLWICGINIDGSLSTRRTVFSIR